MPDRHGRTSDDPLYDWPCRLQHNRVRLPRQKLVCGHEAPFWGENAEGVMEGYCRQCHRLVKTVWQKGE